MLNGCNQTKFNLKLGNQMLYVNVCVRVRAPAAIVEVGALNNTVRLFVRQFVSPVRKCLGLCSRTWQYFAGHHAAQSYGHLYVGLIPRNNKLIKVRLTFKNTFIIILAVGTVCFLENGVIDEMIIINKMITV